MVQHSFVVSVCSSFVAGGPNLTSWHCSSCTLWCAHSSVFNFSYRSSSFLASLPSRSASLNPLLRIHSNSPDTKKRWCLQLPPFHGNIELNSIRPLLYSLLSRPNSVLNAFILCFISLHFLINLIKAYARLWFHLSATKFQMVIYQQEIIKVNLSAFWAWIKSLSTDCLN